MRKHNVKKKKGMVGSAISGLVLASALNLYATPITAIDDTTFSTTGGAGWFSSGVTVSGGDQLTVGISESSYKSAYRTAASAANLGVGETMTLKFDVAADAAVTDGDLRVYLRNTSSLQSYMFMTSLGAWKNQHIGYKSGPISSAPGPDTFYGSRGDTERDLGTDIATSFDTFTFTLERTDADTTVFELWREGPSYGSSTLMVAATKDFTGADAGQLFTEINLIRFGWSNPSGGSLYLDNVSLSVIPEPATLGLLGMVAAFLLVFRRLKI